MRDSTRAPRDAAALEAISARSFINMPLTEQGGLVALLYLNHAEPRPWPDDELAFVREVAERTRVAVERRRAEQALAEPRRVAGAAGGGAHGGADGRPRRRCAKSQKMEAVGQLTGGLRTTSTIC